MAVVVVVSAHIENMTSSGSEAVQISETLFFIMWDGHITFKCSTSIIWSHSVLCRRSKSRLIFMLLYWPEALCVRLSVRVCMCTYQNCPWVGLTPGLDWVHYSKSTKNLKGLC